MEVRVNGRSVAAKTDERHWVTVKRKWRDGDKVTVRLPMEFRAAPLPEGKIYPTAIMYGPVTMAFRTPASNPANKVDLAKLDSQFVPSPGEPLTYHLASDPAVVANRVPHRLVTFSDNWQESDRFRFTNVIGATAEYTFEGTGIKWLGNKFDDGGRAKVTIDGGEIGIVDMYGPGRDLPFAWSYTNLKRGKHTIKILLLPDKTQESKGTYLNVAGFEVIP
jgi:hypothetical protein